MGAPEKRPDAIALPCLVFASFLRSTAKSPQFPSFPRKRESTDGGASMDSRLRGNDGCAETPLGPLGRCRAAEKLADKGRGLFEGRRLEFRSPRQLRAAQGTGRSPAPNGGVFFLCLLSFCTSKKKVRRAASAKPAVKQRHHQSQKDTAQSSQKTRFCPRLLRSTTKIRQFRLASGQEAKQLSMQNL